MNGADSVRSIAAVFGCTEGAIRKRAKARGWTSAADRHSAASQLPADTRAATLVTRSAMGDRHSYGPGYIYCIRVDTGHEHVFKVGFSKNPQLRAVAHQGSLPFDAVICIGYFVPNMRQEEAALHEAFKAKRMRGEWFRLEEADIDFMASRARLA